LFQDAT
jgi:hypothetical protein